MFDFARNFNFVLFTVWLCFLVSSTYFHEFQVSKARIEKVLIYLLDDRLAGCNCQFAAASIQKMQDITKFLLNISENDNPVTLNARDLIETFPIPCEQRPFKRQITSRPFYFRYGTQMVITFLCNIFRSYIIRQFKNIVRIEAGGKNERKERESFLPLIFASW